MEPRGGTFDPDVDTRPVRPRPGPLAPVEDCQRLLANPLLGVVCWIGAFLLLRESVYRHEMVMFVWSVAFVLVGIVFLQFHCLDCGETGSLLRSRAHACAAVVARRQTGYWRRHLLPGLKVQLVAWLFVLMAALVLGFAALESWW